MNQAAVTPTTIACQSCGKAFACDPAGDCWCKAVDVRVPLPRTAAAACFCPDCLASQKPAKSHDD